MKKYFSGRKIFFLLILNPLSVSHTDFFNKKNSMRLTFLCMKIMFSPNLFPLHLTHTHTHHNMLRKRFYVWNKVMNIFMRKKNYVWSWVKEERGEKILFEQFLFVYMCTKNVFFLMILEKKDGIKQFRNSFCQIWNWVETFIWGQILLKCETRFFSFWFFFTRFHT